MIAAVTFAVLGGLPASGELVFLARERDVNVIKRVGLSGTPVVVFANKDATNSNCLHPRWTADGARVEFVAMKDGAWARWSVKPDGTDAHPIDGVPDLVTRATRSDDLEVVSEKGKVVLRRTDTKAVLHSMRPLADGDGIHEANWNADKTAVAFNACQFGFGCKVIAVSADGKASKTIATGTDPDWKR